ncbi:hypothetical protein [uncultured Brevundimonas sp.]|uniref:hypothetical protein n=1 Tax=uncultured Brevundimonas sp. TaxID=213418 RepID=UPI00262DF4B9|nr:hypothetical protein [uncultured Brevundimonas sp.]
MTDDVAHLMLEHLKALRSGQQEIRLELMDIKSRLTSLEVHVGELATQYAGQSARLDRVEERLARIERRLDLVEA